MIMVCFPLKKIFLSNLSNVTLCSFFLPDFASKGLPPVKLQKGPNSTSKSVFICLLRIIFATLSSVSKSKMLLRAAGGG